MPHIRNYLPDNEDVLNQLIFKTMVHTTDFKIGDVVKIYKPHSNEEWTITDFAITADGEPAALLENDTFHTFALLQDIHCIPRC